MKRSTLFVNIENILWRFYTNNDSRVNFWLLSRDIEIAPFFFSFHNIIIAYQCLRQTHWGDNSFKFTQHCRNIYKLLCAVRVNNLIMKKKVFNALPHWCHINWQQLIMNRLERYCAQQFNCKERYISDFSISVKGN